MQPPTLAISTEMTTGLFGLKGKEGELSWFGLAQNYPFFFLKNNYNMLLTLQLESFLPYTPKHFVHGKVSIQLQSL